MRFEGDPRVPRPTLVESVRPWRVTVDGAGSVDAGLAALRSAYDELPTGGPGVADAGRTGQERWLATEATPGGAQRVVLNQFVVARPAWVFTRARLDGELVPTATGCSFTSWARPWARSLVFAGGLAVVMVGAGGAVGFMAGTVAPDVFTMLLGFAVASFLAISGGVAARNAVRVSRRAAATLVASLGTALGGIPTVDAHARPVPPAPPPTEAMRLHQERNRAVRLDLFEGRPWIPIAIAAVIAAFTVAGLIFQQR